MNDKQSQAESFKQGDIVADKKSENLYMMATCGSKLAVYMIHSYIEATDGLPIHSLENRIEEANGRVKQTLYVVQDEDHTKLNELNMEKAKLDELAKELNIGLKVHNDNYDEIRHATGTEYLFAQAFSYIIRLDRLKMIAEVDFNEFACGTGCCASAAYKYAIKELRGRYLPPVRKMQLKSMERRIESIRKQTELYQELEGLISKRQKDKSKEAKINMSLSGLFICSHIEGMFMDALLKTEIHLNDWLRELKDKLLDARMDGMESAICDLQRATGTLSMYYETLKHTIIDSAKLAAVQSRFDMTVIHGPGGRTIGLPQDWKLLLAEYLAEEHESTAKNFTI